MKGLTKEEVRELHFHLTYVMFQNDEDHDSNGQGEELLAEALLLVRPRLMTGDRVSISRVKKSLRLATEATIARCIDDAVAACPEGILDEDECAEVVGKIIAIIEEQFAAVPAVA